MKVSSSLLLLGAAISPMVLADHDSEHTLQTVLVESSHIAPELKEEQALIPGATTIIDGDEQFQRSVNNLADTLRYTPSIWAQSASGGDAIFFSSRGSNLDATDYDENGIKLLQDGLPVTAADGNNHNRFIDPLSARYIVVAPGANALTYGASTLGGAINFISPTARDVAPQEVFVSAGSNEQANMRATAATVADQFDAMVTVDDKHWGGYRHHSETDRQSVYANAGWQFSEALENRVYFTYLNNDQQLPSALTKAQFEDDPDQAGTPALLANRGKDLETWRIADKTTWTIDDRSSLEFGLSYEEQSLYHPIVEPIMVDFDGPGPMQPVEVFSLIVDTDHRESAMTLRYNLQLGNHDLLAGIDYGNGDVDGGNYRNYYGKRNGLTETVDNNADTVQAYLMDRWALGQKGQERWTLVYGAQAVSAGRDVETTSAASGAVRNPNDDYSSINPRAGLIYALTNNSELFTNVSRVFEPPTTFELEDDVRGNNDTLDAMHGTVVEFGSRGQMPLGFNKLSTENRLNWEAAIYYAQIHDEILSMDDPAAPGNSLTTNIDKTTHAGIEALLGASFALDAGSSIEPLVSFTYNDFHFDGDKLYGDNELPAAPDFVMRGEILYRQANGFYIGPTFDIVGERYADFTNSYEVDSYELLGLRAGYDAKKWEVFAELKNLTDEDYVSTLSVLDNANVNSAILYPGAPLSVYAGVRMQF